MDVSTVLSVALPVVFIIVGIVLVAFLIELTRTIKVARTTVVEMKNQMDPLLANVQKMTDELVPVVAKMDPVVDRVQLTLDTVNLEMMRVDEILEDVSEITDKASSATTAIDNVASAPVHLANNVASKVKGVFKGKDSSKESKQLEQQRVAIAKALDDYKAAEEKAEVEGANAEKAATFAADEAVAEADAGQPEETVNEGYFTYDEPAAQEDAADAEQVEEPAEPESAAEAKQEA